MRVDTLLAPRSVLVLAALLLPGVLAAQLPPIGLNTAGAQWFRNDDWLRNEPTAGDRFGAALAAGDFNGDGADDLATGVPYDNEPDIEGGALDTGSVVVRYGVPGTALSDDFIDTELREPGPDNGAGEQFGFALAAGDFNGDGFDDLAVGVPISDQRGAVYIYYGLSGGLQLDGLEIFDESFSPEPEHLCVQAMVGWSLAAGNFDGDAYDDLAIGAPQACEKVGGSLIHGGAVFVAHGQEWGLLPFWGYRISQNSYAIADEVQSGDRFGEAVATGDFNHDGYDDLAVGVSEEGSEDTGAIQVLMGSQWGLLFANNVFWLPGALGEVSETGDKLGKSLASGDFDGDGFDDLAIGSPFEDLGPDDVYEDTGSVAIAYGAADPAWFDLSRTEHLAQSTIWHDEAFEGVDDFFGWSLAAGDFDGDHVDDLAIGAHGDDWGGLDLGAVTVLTGSPFGIAASTRFFLISVGWDGVPGNTSEIGQHSAWSVVAGDFDGNQYSDLVIGVPLYDVSAPSNSGADAGSEVVLYGAPIGALLSDGFELGSLSRWSAKTF